MTDLANAQPGVNAGGTSGVVTPEPKPWLEQVEESLRSNETLRGFNGPNDLAKDYLTKRSELEKVQGDLKGMLKVPGKDATPEEKAAYLKALGVPEKAEEYEFPKTEGIEHDAKMLGWARETFHKAGLNKEQAASISQAWDGFIKGMEQSLAEAETKAFAEVETKLKTDWGAEYDKNFELSKRAFKKFAGSELSEFKAHPVLVKAFYEVGKAMGEDSSLPGSQASGDKPVVGMKYNMPDFK